MFSNSSSCTCEYIVRGPRTNGINTNASYENEKRHDRRRASRDAVIITVIIIATVVVWRVYKVFSFLLFIYNPRRRRPLGVTRNITSRRLDYKNKYKYSNTMQL